MTYTFAEFIVNKLLMMDRGNVRNMIVSNRSKFGKLVHLVGFIVKKFVTMHGHINIKKGSTLCFFIIILFY